MSTLCRVEEEARLQACMPVNGCLFIRNIVDKGSSTLAFFASVSPSAMAPLPNCFLCFSCAITYVKTQRKLVGSGAIADIETDAKNASVDGP
jgi:hypothetical protein